MARHDSIDAVITEMDRVIDRSIDTADARGWFAIVYRAVTDRVRTGLEAGQFDDVERMERFDVRFARYWLDAHSAWDRAEPVSASWAVSFEAARRPGLILQHLLLGMNAHINLDLGVAAAATCPGPAVADLRDDFERINDVLAELVDQMQLAIADVSPLTRSLDAVGLRFDEALTCFSLEHARRRSWEFAADLAAAVGDAGTRDPGGAAAMIASRDEAVARNGARIADPGRPLRWLLPLARHRERADLAGVAESLCGRGAALA
ncbi:DUF5995 family protein [Actinotalea sp.]|uniref:DUF5995 family protein n=1 Tax=Actinotalea sp. TaxID=1872145 RepID=UPI00356551CF